MLREIPKKTKHSVYQEFKRHHELRGRFQSIFEDRLLLVSARETIK
jgi:hypothetical protein